MEKLEVKEWMAVNRVIYKIYGDEDFDRMREEFLEHLNLFIDFDSAYFYTANKNNELVFENPVVYHCETVDEMDFSIVPSLAEIIHNQKSIVFRETDIVEDSKWPTTKNYKLYYRPNNWHYGMRLILAMDKKVLGMVVLFRNFSKKNFDINDVLMLDMFKDHLALRLKRALYENTQTSNANLQVYERITKKYDLTKKESEVIGFLSKGYGAEQISERLDVSVNTVKKHTVNIYRKLGINKRIQLFQMFAS